MTLTEFLLARIAEDETWAQSDPRVIDAPHVGAVRLGMARYLTSAPSRVLAECEAKRRIVEFHAPWSPRADVEACSMCSGDDYGTLLDYPCATLLALAAVYADHPDYREEWKP